jgi:RNA polymerase sigma-70 factor, ECF subfamily
MPRPFPSAPPSDEELAQRAQRGCMRSFEELLRKFQVPLLHFLRQRGAADDAEDLLQETFIRVYNALPRYRRRWRFATWVYTIARRVSINHHRRARPVAAAEALPWVEAKTPGPAQAAVEEEDRDYLWGKAAEVLSEGEMTAMWLHYVEDMPVRQIAVILGRSWVAVKTMMFRARKRLRPLLTEFQPDGGPQEAGGPLHRADPLRPAVEVPHV